MPFIDQQGDLLKSIELGQVPVPAPTFQLRQTIGWYPEGGDPKQAVWVKPHQASERPDSGERTDLASVPAIFWSLIASYGRQTAPAIMHDSECWRVRREHRLEGSISAGEALRQRRLIDRNFRLALRELEVTPFRAWLMWTFVSFERYQKHSVPRFLGMLLLGALGIASVVLAPVAIGLLALPWWLGAVLLALPLLTALIAAPRWLELVWLSYAGALMLPVAVLQVAAFLPYTIVENVAWLVRDQLFRRRGDRKGTPQIGPTDVKNILRSAA